MRRTWKHWLAALLALAMAFTMLPAATLAADSGTPADNQAEHTPDDHSGGGIVSADLTELGDGIYYLNGDVTVTSTINVTGNATLCLNGKTLTIQSDNVGMLIREGASLTLSDCSERFGTLEIELSGYLYDAGIKCEGHFTMTGGTLHVSEKGSAMLRGVYVQNKKVNVVISGGTISVIGKTGHNCYGICDEFYGSVKIGGSAKIYAESAWDDGFGAVDVISVGVDYAELRIEDAAEICAVAKNSNATAVGVDCSGYYDSYSGKFTQGFVYISGGNVSATSEKHNGYGIRANDGGNMITVSGGSITGSTYGASLGVNHYLLLSGTPTISGGEEDADIFLWSVDTAKGNISAQDSDGNPYYGNSDDPLTIAQSGTWKTGDVVVSNSLEEHCDTFGLIGAEGLALRHKNENIIVDEKVIYTMPELTKERLTDTSTDKNLLSKPGTVENEGYQFQYALGADDTTAPEDSAFSPIPPVGDKIGDYYVWWRILDGDMDIDEPPTYLGMVTIYHHDNYSETWRQDPDTDQHYKICDVEGCGEELDRGNHSWEQKSEDKTTGTRTYVCTACKIERILKGDQRVVSGRVLQHDGVSNAVGATVKLMKGSEELGKTVTDDNGYYVFTKVEPGTYDIVVEYEIDGTSITTTVLETVTADADVDMEPVTLNSKNVNSELNVQDGADTPAVVVGGLDKEAQAQEMPGKTVTVVMSVKGLTDGAAGNTPEIQKDLDQINTAVENKAGILQYLDLSLEKVVVDQTSKVETKSELHETKNDIRIVVPLDTKGKTNIVVYRLHDGIVDTLTEDKNAEEHFIFTPGEAGQPGTLEIYAKHFSVYAIGYRLFAVKLPEENTTGTVTADKLFASAGDSVTLTVTPADEYEIGSIAVKDASDKEVTLTDNKDGTYTFTMPSGDVTVSAAFTKKQYAVRIPAENITGSGTVVASPTTAAKGDTVTLTATPGDEYEIGSVAVKDASDKEVTLTDNKDGTYTFTMPSGDVTVSAAFTKKQYAVSIPAENITGSGTVDASPTTAAKGDTVTLTATPDDGYKIKSVTVKDSNGKDVPVTDNGDGTYTFTQPAGDVTVTAVFTLEQTPTPPAPQRYPIYIPSENITGSGSVVADPTDATEGDTVTLTATPDDGYKTESVTVTDSTGNVVPVTDNGDGTYTFTQPAGNVTVTATFVKKEPQKYPVLIPSESIFGSGSVVADRAESAEGDTVTLTVTPERGYYLYSLKVLDQDGKPVALTRTGRNTYTFTQPAGGVTVTATFALIQYSEPEPTPTPTPKPTPSTTPVSPSTPATPSNPAPATYSITVPAATTGGSVTADPERAAEGASVKLTVKAEVGYHLDALTVLDQDGKAVALQDNQDGTYTFTMHKGAASVQATFVKCSTLSFPDLDPTAWYHEHTDYVISHGLMNGNEKGLFEPNGTVTRAQMVTLLWNLKGKPVVNFYMTYSDVSEETWYAEAIRWATSEGIVSGCGDGSFGPADTITREQMATMIYQYEKKYGDGGFTGTWMFRMPFNDLDQISEWAYEGVAWCYMNQVISGKSADLFDPQGIATRTEMAAILTQYLTLE